MKKFLGSLLVGAVLFAMQSGARASTSLPLSTRSVSELFYSRTALQANDVGTSVAPVQLILMCYKGKQIYVFPSDVATKEHAGATLGTCRSRFSSFFSSSGTD